MNFHEDAELSNAIKAQATRHEAPSALRERIAAKLQAAPLIATPRPSRSLWVVLQQQWVGMGAAFAFGLILSLAVVFFHAASSDDDRVLQEVVAAHVRSLMVAHLEDVASTDQHTVKPWFSGKLDFSPPVHDLAIEGFPLAGGRLDYLNQHPVAALVYRRQLHTINLFVWPTDSTSQHEIKLMSRQGFNITAWTDSGMQYWAVSDLNAAGLKTFTQLLRQKIDS